MISPSLSMTIWYSYIRDNSLANFNTKAGGKFLCQRDSLRFLYLAATDERAWRRRTLHLESPVGISDCCLDPSDRSERLPSWSIARETGGAHQWDPIWLLSPGQIAGRFPKVQNNALQSVLRNFSQTATTFAWLPRCRGSGNCYLQQVI